MSNTSKVIAIIPARGQSKRLPRKNIRMLCGKPLIAWSIDAAKQVSSIDRVILSTEDLEIAQVARDSACEVLIRDPSLAQDDTSTIDTVLDILEQCSGYEWLILLQPTSPLRTAADIEGAFQFCLECNADSCVSVAPITKSPYWMYRINDNILQPILTPESESASSIGSEIFVLNGAIYIVRVSWLQRHKKLLDPSTVGFKMTQENSVDIDTLDDFQLAEAIMRRLHDA